jgi:uncharacterized protein YeaO (DUF488 family)
MRRTSPNQLPDAIRSEVVQNGPSLAARTAIGPHRQDVRIKRAYEQHTPEDDQRVLVDRLWPRGLSRHELEDVVWLRDVAPTAGLRKWFGHKPERWQEFRARYFAELRSNPAVETLRKVVAAGPVTLIYGARDEAHNQAVALAAYLAGKAPRAEEDDQ